MAGKKNPQQPKLLRILYQTVRLNNQPGPYRLS